MTEFEEVLETILEEYVRRDTEGDFDTWEKTDSFVKEKAEVLLAYANLQEEPVNIWHDAGEKAEKGKLYLYRTNQNIVDINRSEGKEFPDYCERWAYIDDLFKL